MKLKDVIEAALEGSFPCVRTECLQEIFCVHQARDACRRAVRESLAEAERRVNPMYASTLARVPICACREKIRALAAELDEPQARSGLDETEGASNE